MAHTPGPWLAGERAPEHLSGQCPVIAPGCGGRLIAICFTEPDAKLIAATPELAQIVDRFAKQASLAGVVARKGSFNPLENLLAQAEQALAAIGSLAEPAVGE